MRKEILLGLSILIILNIGYTTAKFHSNFENEATDLLTDDSFEHSLTKKSQIEEPLHKGKLYELRKTNSFRLEFLFLFCL
jgi:hypothetical protein